MLVSKTEFHVVLPSGNVERYPKNFPKDDIPEDQQDLVGDHIWHDDEEGLEPVPMAEEEDPIADPPERGLDSGPVGEDGTPAEYKGDDDSPHLGDRSKKVHDQIVDAKTVDQRRDPEELNKLTSAELKSIAEQANIKGYKSMSKAELIDAIVDHEG